MRQMTQNETTPLRPFSIESDAFLNDPFASFGGHLRLYARYTLNILGQVDYLKSTCAPVSRK